MRCGSRNCVAKTEEAGLEALAQLDDRCIYYFGGGECGVVSYISVVHQGEGSSSPINSVHSGARASALARDLPSADWAAVSTTASARCKAHRIRAVRDPESHTRPMPYFSAEPCSKGAYRGGHLAQALWLRSSGPGSLSASRWKINHVVNRTDSACTCTCGVMSTERIFS